MPDWTPRAILKNQMSSEKQPTVGLEQNVCKMAPELPNTAASQGAACGPDV